MTIKEQNKRDRFAIKNDKVLTEYHSREIAIGILDDDLPDHYNEWIGTQSLKDLSNLVNNEFDKMFLNEDGDTPISSLDKIIKTLTNK